MANFDENQDRGSTIWLTVPPIPTLVIALALLPFSDESRSLTMGAAFWLFVTMIYMFISVAYVICLGRDLKEGLSPLQILGQGVAMLVLPLGLGAPYALSWIGLALSFAGTVTLINKIMAALDEPRESREKEDAKEIGAFLEEVPLPTLDVDKDGVILGANSDMLNLLDVDETVLLGQRAEVIFPNGVNKIEARGTGWQVLRKPGEGGSELICLIEEVAPPPAREIEEKGEMLHPPTGLFSTSYASIMIPAEFKRSIRYRRWLSIIKIKLKISLEGSEANNEMIQNIFNLYGAFIKKHTRECDLGFFMGYGDFLILLPETPNAGAKATLDKFKKIPEDIVKNIPLGMNISIWGGLFHCSGHEKIDYNEAMATLEDNLKELDRVEPQTINLESLKDKG